MIISLTDFGQSEYVGVMKGVIYGIDRDAKIVDLCHDISPQNIIEASWVLKNSHKYFPEGAIFCCVVDPGVGTERKALGVKTADYYFVAPDNGLLWETLKEQEIIDTREIPIPKDASNTFHGRDVFAKAAANIDLGHFDTLGTKAEEIKRLELHQDGRVGIVVRIDRFGNVITNLPGEDKTTYSVKVEEKSCRMNFYPNYNAAEDDELFLIEGSCNTLEISLRNGNANKKLNVETGTRIEIL
ncbi:MAG: SAM-dependent chlorinase/fluorinase [Phycisphaerales bacterium]|jgi:S-adenosylmethionine hydrolase